MTKPPELRAIEPPRDYRRIASRFAANARLPRRFLALVSRLLALDSILNCQGTCRVVGAHHYREWGGPFLQLLLGHLESRESRASNGGREQAECSMRQLTSVTDVPECAGRFPQPRLLPNDSAKEH